MSILVPGLNPAFNKPAPKPKPKPMTVGGHFGPGGEILPGPAPKSNPPKHSTSSSPKHSTSLGGCFGPGGEILAASDCKKKGIPLGTPKSTPATVGGPGGSFGPGGEIVPAKKYSTLTPKQRQFTTLLGGPSQPMYSEGVQALAFLLHTTPEDIVKNLSGLPTAPSNASAIGIVVPGISDGIRNVIEAAQAHNFVILAYRYGHFSGFTQTIRIARDFGAQSVTPGGVQIHTDGIYGNIAGLGTGSAEILILSTRPGYPMDQSEGNPFAGLYSRVRNGQRGANTDPTHVQPGIYAVPGGTAAHRFNMIPMVGHSYTNTIIIAPDSSSHTYTIRDNTTGQTESWTDRDSFDNLGFKLSSVKSIRTGEEWWTKRRPFSGQDLGPTAVRYDTRVTAPPSYLVHSQGRVMRVQAGPPLVDQLYRGDRRTINPAAQPPNLPPVLPKGCGPGTDGSLCCNPRTNPHCLE